MDGRRGAEASAGTRELILDAARQEIARRGYDAATMRAIARRAGVDPRLIRYYFADKRSLAAAALGEFDLLDALAAERGDLPAGLVAVWHRRPVEWRALLAGAASADPEVRQAFVAALDTLVAAARTADDPDGLRALLALAHLVGIWMTTALPAAPGTPAEARLIAAADLVGERRPADPSG
ncbi:MAG: helix-turn-helix domain-containing protein [Mycobacteriales bacterium]